MSQDAIFILKQIRSVIDDFLSKATVKEEPTPIIIQSSQPVYTKLSELSLDAQDDYRRGTKEIKKAMEKMFNLKPSEEV